MVYPPRGWCCLLTKRKTCWLQALSDAAEVREVREIAFPGEGGEAGTHPPVRDFAGPAWVGGWGGQVHDLGRDLQSHHRPSDPRSLCWDSALLTEQPDRKKRVYLQSCLIPFNLKPKSSSSPSVTAFSSPPRASFPRDSDTARPGPLDGLLKSLSPWCPLFASQSCGCPLSQPHHFPPPLVYALINALLGNCKPSFCSCSC